MVRGSVGAMSVVFAVLSALCYGTADFSGGYATRRTPVQAVLLFSQTVGLLVGLLSAWLIVRGLPEGKDLLWGGLAGLAGALGLAALYHGLASAASAIVSPIAAATGAAIPVLFGVIIGERPGTAAWLGVVLALAAITLLSYEPKSADRSRGPGISLGLVAGLGFGLFFIFISRTGETSGLWPLVVGRVVSVTSLVLLAGLTRRSLGISGLSRGVAVLAGVLDMGANVFFLLAARSGLLMISTVITSLYPAPTVVLSVFLLGERMTPVRALGLVLAVGGVALMTI
jgi:drug/metabolite transporter (DMT)-like permease